MTALRDIPEGSVVRLLPGTSMGDGTSLQQEFLDVSEAVIVFGR